MHSAADDQIVPIRCDNLEKGLGRGFHVAVHKRLAGAVENTHVHGLHVQIDPAIVTMLTVVESHLSSPPARHARMSLRQSLLSE
jgi:hypothetical protein